MKKLFSYLLISSMVVLSSCTNYDDQFDDLNSQINSLKSQIEGFSSLSSGLTALQGTVSSLQSAVAALPKTATPATDISGLEASVASLQTQLASASTSAEVTALTAQLTAAQTALADAIAANATAATDNATAIASNATNIEKLLAELSTLATSLDAIKTDLANAATAEAVTKLQADLLLAQADLATILAQNNVYTPDATNGLVINSAASLDVADSLGSQLTIINGGVNITNGTTNALDATKLQAVLDRIVTVTGTMTYTQSGTGSSVNFDALTSAGNLSIDNEHDISLASLSNVGTLTVSNDAKVTSFSAPKLATVAFASHTLDLPKATKIDLTSLTAYSNASLTINGNTSSTGFDLVMPNIQSNGPDGIVRNNFHLTIGGVVNNLTLAKMVNKSSRITANDAKVINLAAFNGTLDSGATSNHVSVTLGAAMKNYTSGPKLETFKGTGVLDPAVLTSVGPTFTFASTSVKLDSVEVLGQVGALDFNGNDSVTTVTISADASSVDLSGSTSLTSVVISGDIDDAVDFSSSTSLETATVSGDAESITFVGNSSLTSVSLTGGTGYVKVDNCDSLTSLDLSHTSKWFANRDATTAEAAAAVAAAAKGAELHITGNAELASLSADKITSVEDLVITANPLLTTISFDAITASAAATGGATVNVGAVSGGSPSGSDITASANKLHAQSIVLGDSVAVTGGSKLTGTITSNSGISDLAAFIKATVAKASHDVAVVFDQVDTFTDETGVSDTEVTMASTGLSNTESAKSIVTVASSKNNTAGSTGTDLAVSKAFEVATADGSSLTITVNGKSKSYTRAGAAGEVHEELSAFTQEIADDSYWTGTANIDAGTLDLYSAFTVTAAATAAVATTTLYLDTNTAVTTPTIRIVTGDMEIGTASTTTEVAAALAGQISNTFVETYNASTGTWSTSTTVKYYADNSAGVVRVFAAKDIDPAAGVINLVRDRKTAGFSTMNSPAAGISFVSTPGGYLTDYLKVSDAVVSTTAGTSISYSAGTAIAASHDVDTTDGTYAHKKTGVSAYVGTTILTNTVEFKGALNASNGRGDAIVTGTSNIANNSPRYVTTYWTWN